MSKSSRSRKRPKITRARPSGPLHAAPHSENTGHGPEFVFSDDPNEPPSKSETFELHHGNGRRFCLIEATGEPAFFVWMFDIDGSVMGSIEVDCEFKWVIKITGPDGGPVWACELPMPKVQADSVGTTQEVGNPPVTDHEIMSELVKAKVLA